MFNKKMTLQACFCHSGMHCQHTGSIMVLAYFPAWREVVRWANKHIVLSGSTGIPSRSLHVSPVVGLHSRGKMRQYCYTSPRIAPTTHMQLTESEGGWSTGQHSGGVLHRQISSEEARDMWHDRAHETTCMTTWEGWGWFMRDFHHITPCKGGQCWGTLAWLALPTELCY